LNINKKISVLFILCLSSIAFSQLNNRISVGTGLFHSFFDGSAIVNKNLNNYKRVPRNLFKGILTDSKGIQYQRILNKHSSISAEYMFLNTGYDYKVVINNPAVKPVLSSRNLKYVNLTYSRLFSLHDKFNFVCGAGLNYIWGHESLYHYTSNDGGWGESYFYGYYRHDFGLNLRTGIEYSPLKWLTVYTNFDFIGIVYLGTEDVAGKKIGNFYNEKFNLKNIPSRYDLSWRFGIGINFGKRNH
jgi:hypothetical protein